MLSSTALERPGLCLLTRADLEFIVSTSHRPVLDMTSESLVCPKYKDFEPLLHPGSAASMLEELDKEEWIRMAY